MGSHRTSPQRQSDQAQGFTIIEVLIVLAIAGIIMLLVFEAIPALSRNSRNNQRRQDVSTLLEAVSHYQLNNSARYPMMSDLTLKLTYYNPANITLHSESASTASDQAALSGSAALDEVQVYDYLKCDPNNPGNGITQGTDYTNIAALYAIETGSGTLGQCQQL